MHLDVMRQDPLQDSECPWPIADNFHYFAQRLATLLAQDLSSNTWHKNAVEELEGMELPAATVVTTKDLTSKLSGFIERICNDKNVPCDMPIIIDGLSSNLPHFSIHDYSHATDEDNFVAIELVNDDCPEYSNILDFECTMGLVKQGYDKSTEFTVKFFFHGDDQDDKSILSLSILVLSQNPSNAFGTLGSVAIAAKDLCSSRLSALEIVSNVSEFEDLPSLQISPTYLSTLVKLQDVSITFDGWCIVSCHRLLLSFSCTLIFAINTHSIESS